MKHFHREAIAISQALAMWHAVICTMLLDLHRILRRGAGVCDYECAPHGEEGLK